MFSIRSNCCIKYEETESNPERVSNIKPFINKYNWKGINYPSKRDDWKTFKKKNPTLVLNILYTKDKEIYPAYIPRINLNCEIQIILLMIPNKGKEAWHYHKKAGYIIKRNNIKISW